MPKPHTPKYLPKDHLTLFLPLLFRFLLVMSKVAKNRILLHTVQTLAAFALKTFEGYKENVK